MKCRVYDDRTNETLFENDNRIDCALWMSANFDEDSDGFQHIWIEDITA